MNKIQQNLLFVCFINLYSVPSRMNNSRIIVHILSMAKVKKDVYAAVSFQEWQQNFCFTWTIKVQLNSWGHILGLSQRTQKSTGGGRGTENPPYRESVLQASRSKRLVKGAHRLRSWIGSRWDLAAGKGGSELYRQAVLARPRTRPLVMLYSHLGELSHTEISL